MRSDQRDSYRTRLAASVMDHVVEDDATWVRLSDSVFYPTSGGQPHDTGVLRHDGGDAAVTDVTPDGPDGVLHRVEGPLPEVGATVEARIDWDRRYRHMQRHTAQHLLSQAFVRTGPGFATRSVSLTSPDATLDLAGEPGPDALAAAFAQARAWAYEALGVASFEVHDSELDAYPLRRPAKVSGTVRLVRIGEVELSACGGTHLRSAAETLPLLLVSHGRIRGGLTRVAFRAGIEAGERADALVAQANRLAHGFSARWDQLEERVDALRSELRDARSEVARARAAWAEAGVRLAVDDQPGPVVRVACDDPALLAPLAEACATLAPGAVAVLGAAPGAGDGGRATVLLQAGPEVAAEVDLRPVLREALQAVDGKGGGKPDRGQGAGPRAAGLQEALDLAEARVRTHVGRDAN
ncbi:MAG: alanine--tRNA ligase-related protein [Trueperaceae bacterium]